MQRPRIKLDGATALAAFQSEILAPLDQEGDGAVHVKKLIEGLQAASQSEQPVETVAIICFTSSEKVFAEVSPRRNSAKKPSKLSS